MVSENLASHFEFQITTDSPEATKQLGEKIGRHIDANMVIALFGDLGSGKTAFVQGLARGLDVPDGYYVTSPTYTLINEYPGRHTLYHIDLYRIDSPVDFAEIGIDEILYNNGVSIAQKLVEREQLHVNIGVWPVHAVFLLGAVAALLAQSSLGWRWPRLGRRRAA